LHSALKKVYARRVNRLGISLGVSVDELGGLLRKSLGTAAGEPVGGVLGEPLEADLERWLGIALGWSLSLMGAELGTSLGVHPSQLEKDSG
jgi:hypothetical protein